MARRHWLTLLLGAWLGMQCLLVPDTLATVFFCARGHLADAATVFLLQPWLPLVKLAFGAGCGAAGALAILLWNGDKKQLAGQAAFAAGAILMATEFSWVLSVARPLALFGVQSQYLALVACEASVLILGLVGIGFYWVVTGPPLWTEVLRTRR